MGNGYCNYWQVPKYREVWALFCVLLVVNVLCMYFFWKLYCFKYFVNKLNWMGILLHK